MNQVLLETNSSIDLQLILLLAKRLKVKVLEIDQKKRDDLSLEAIPPLDGAEMQQLLQSSRAMDFLAAEEEDIYSDEDLKVMY